MCMGTIFFILLAAASCSGLLVYLAGSLLVRLYYTRLLISSPHAGLDGLGSGSDWIGYPFGYDRYEISMTEGESQWI